MGAYPFKIIPRREKAVLADSHANEKYVSVSRLMLGVCLLSEWLYGRQLFFFVQILNEK